MRKRDQRAKIHFTSEELAEVKRKAQAEGLDMSKYIRKKIAESDVVSAPDVDVPALIRQVSLVGRMFNDILVRANSTGFVDLPAFYRALDRNREVEKIIIEAYKPDREKRKEALSNGFHNG